MRARVLVAALLLIALTNAHASPTKAWITAWSASPVFVPPEPRADDVLSYSNQTARQELRLGIAARSIRLRLTNELGKAPVVIGQVFASVANEAPVAVFFSGAPGIAIAAGGSALSDPIAIDAPAFADVSISVYYPSEATVAAHRGNVRIAPGAVVMPAMELPPSRAPAIVSAVEVQTTADRQPEVIVAFGDSITEGAGSTPGAHADWPSLLARRLEASQPGRFVVVNAGIGGNRLLDDGGSPGALNRFDRDVLALPGVTQMILLIGINDIRRWESNEAGVQRGSAQMLMDGYAQLVARAHAHGIRVIGATITPYGGTNKQSPFGLETVEATNNLIRSTNLFDAVIDFAAAVRDPANPQRMLESHHKGDHLHPNDTGYRAMASAIPLQIFDSRAMRM